LTIGHLNSYGKTIFDRLEAQPDLPGSIAIDGGTTIGIVPAPRRFVAKLDKFGYPANSSIVGASAALG